MINKFNSPSKGKSDSGLIDLMAELELKVREFAIEELRKLNYNKRGHPFIYPDILILYAAVIKFTLDLSYRELSDYIYYIFEVKISKSQLRDRIANLKINPIEMLKNEKIKIEKIAIDTNGFKPTNKGEWRIIKHENGKIKLKKGYIKLSLATDINNLFITSFIIADAQTAYIRLFPYHLKEIKKWKIKKVFCDGAYDSFGVYRRLIEKRIECVIKPRKTAIIYYSKKNLHPYTLRDVYMKLSLVNLSS